MDSIQKRIVEKMSKKSSDLKLDVRNTLLTVKKQVEALAVKEFQMILNNPDDFIVESYDKNGKVFYTFKYECSDKSAINSYFHLYEKLCSAYAELRFCENNDELKAKCYAEVVKLVQSVYAYALLKNYRESMEEFDWDVSVDFSKPVNGVICKSSFDNVVTLRSYKSERKVKPENKEPTSSPQPSNAKTKGMRRLKPFLRMVMKVLFWLVITGGSLFFIGLCFVAGVQSGFWTFEGVLGRDLMDFISSIDFLWLEDFI